MPEKNGSWKKLVDKLKKIAPGLTKIAPDVLSTAGTIVGGPVGIGLEAMARMVAKLGPDEDLDAVADVIMANPQLMVQMEELALQREKMILDNDTLRIQAVNATMQTEATSEDKWTRRWRPFWGFITGACWGVLAITICAVILLVAVGLAQAVVLSAIAGMFDSMWAFWGVALAVLGVSAYTRGKEKIELARKGAWTRMEDSTTTLE